MKHQKHQTNQTRTSKQENRLTWSYTSHFQELLWKKWSRISFTSDTRGDEKCICKARSSQITAKVFVWSSCSPEHAIFKQSKKWWKGASIWKGAVLKQFWETKSSMANSFFRFLSLALHSATQHNQLWSLPLVTPLENLTRALIGQMKFSHHVGQSCWLKETHYLS